MSKSTRPAIAVVGVSALFPGSLNATGFWRDILEGTDRISDVPSSHWLIEDYYDDDKSAQDMTYARRGAFLGDVDFDALGWGVPPSIVPATDTSQLLALIVAQRVLDDAARQREVDRSRISVILGVTSAQELLGTMVSRLQRPVWRKSLRDAGLPESEVTDICNRISDHYVPWQESSFPGLLGNVVAGRIANRLDLGGTNCVTDAACASTFSAIAMGANELYLGDSDMVIVGGVDTMNDIFMYMCFSKTPALSASGDCRPFSDQADGTMLGEGLGMVALKRLEDAERDGDHIYAVLTGVGSSSDGRAKSVYAPRSSGQANAIRRAYDRAGYGPDTVELLEAHGTGTKAGDAAEFGGLRMVFDEAGRADRQWCALGSVKSQIGHTKAAAGAAGLFKAVMALRHGVLPPTIKIDRPNPALELEKSAFYLATTARPWVRGADHPRRAGVSSFGFGGSNFHLAMEEYTGPADAAPRMRTASHELVILTGRSGADVAAQAKKHADQATVSGYLHWLAHTSQSAYTASAPARLAVVATDEADLVAKLTAAAARIEKAPSKAMSTPDGTSYGVGAADGTTAFLFPGQGSQYVGMTGGAAMAHAEALSAWDDAAALGLHEVVFPITAFDDAGRTAQSERLTRTENAQPAIGISSRAMLNLLTRTGLTPAMVGGHSYGEVTALYAAGVLSADNLVSVARRRGELMAEAAQRPGAMTAVSAPIEAVAEKAAKLGVVVANHNHPTQVVLSGPTEAVAAAEEALAADGLRCRRLSVATAFHSPVVSDSVEPFAAFLAGVEIGTATVPVYANATAAPYPADGAAIREQLSTQIRSTVRFVEMIEAMYASGARTFVEVGPNAVLTGLVGRILKGRAHAAVSMDRKNTADLKAMTIGLAQLVAAGADFAPAEALWADYGTPDNPHERAKPKLAIPINGANYGKPYPPKAGAAGLPSPNPARTPQIVEKVVEKIVEKIVEVPVEVRVEVPVAHAPGAPAVAAAPVAQTFAAAQPVAPSMAWIEAWQSAQEQTAEAHSAYQRAMADAHSAFLKTAETSFMGLSALAGGFSPAQPMAQPVAAPMPVAAPVIAETPAPAAAAPTARPAPVAAKATAPARNLHALLLDVVAEKTGYPAEMLSMEMQLEGDLGIDSIKRVEILSAMQEKAPELPEVDAGAMASLQTLGQIADYMGAKISAGPIAAAAAPLVEAPSVSPTVDLGRYALETIEAPAAGMATPGLLDGQRVVITDDGAGVADALAKALVDCGVPARTVDAVPADAEVVLFLGGLRPVTSDTEAAAINREGFDAAKAVAARFSESGGVFVTVQDTGGAFGFTTIPAHRAWLSGLAALARTAAQEWPAAQVRTIDLERSGRSPAALAAALVDELLCGGPEREVGLSADGTRRILHDVRLPAPTGAPILGASDVMVVSGGARGVTASSVIALASATGAAFALLGRTPLVDEPASCAGVTDDAGLKRVLLSDARTAGKLPTPAGLGRQVRQILANREIRGTIAAIEAAGGAARYVSVDVTDADGLASAMTAIRTDWGPITGIIHGAGVINDKLIAEKSGEDFDWVFHTKVGGLTALLSATADDPLKALVMFSSVAARCGNRGQVDYAMANEVLNKVAQAESAARGIAVRSLGWGPWEGGMVSPQLKAHFEALGVTLIPLKEGADMLVDELRADADRVELVLGGAPRAEALIAEGGAAEQRMELRIDRASHPYLIAHAIDGTPVVPVVLVVEWFARAASGFKPGLTLTAISEVKVLSGIRLSNFDAGGDRFQLSCRQLSNGDGATVALELRGIDGKLHYTATAELVIDRAAPKHTAPTLSLEDWGGKAIYDSDVLFHGPDFQVIREVEGLSDDGISAALDGVSTIGWSGKNWRTDPAAFDGGLQLALLWSQRVLGGASLPTGIDEVRTWTDTPSTGALRCVLKGRTVSRGKAVSDLAFLDSDGVLIAELNGVVTHLLPSRG
ncbi:MAG: SDR family oxidoreductase [Myxococcota bacterium]|nr:SDR family oxidoreductase [Myxococcota bacterium]